MFERLKEKRIQKQRNNLISFIKARYPEDEYHKLGFIKTDKDVECYIVVLDEIPALYIFIHPLKDTPSKLLATISNDVVTIGDIQTVKPNCGYGTLMLNTLKNYAIIKNVNIITGYLSDVDIGHRNRQVYFYEKNGFEVKGTKIVYAINKQN